MRRCRARGGPWGLSGSLVAPADEPHAGELPTLTARRLPASLAPVTRASAPRGRSDGREPGGREGCVHEDPTERPHVVRRPAAFPDAAAFFATRAMSGLGATM